MLWVKLITVTVVDLGALASLQKCGVRDDLIFGPRAGDGIALLTADNEVLWDDAKTGKTGRTVEALMHSATLAKRKSFSEQ